MWNIRAHQKKDDVFRFAGYSLRLYNKIREKSEKENPIMQTVVIYSPLVNEKDVLTSFSYGSLKFTFEAIFLANIQNESPIEKILNRIKEDPETPLTYEERMNLV
ncbi:hypothetical protein LC087_11675 [Bacillus carboniphilus]|uniref:Uncharacterized protein n=1 Tax=Bacillus carboniphilus TaxID=86663 RepID=A0ABY9JQ88_9BACI|nr:hypothetical protein [Bacillus carboniphilus]WLR41546.1 hypothetical protein LC087_11675 [Bacillus carboniphilus]